MLYDTDKLSMDILHKRLEDHDRYHLDNFDDIDLSLVNINRSVTDMMDEITGYIYFAKPIDDHKMAEKCSACLLEILMIAKHCGYTLNDLIDLIPE